MLAEDPEVRFNRATLLAAVGRHAEAVADFTASGDAPDSRRGRAMALRALGRDAEADGDLRACAAAQA
ncbi:hypothetical protein [Mangrovihabitans endophyticus]|uniref:Tetratricopeptide repeat-containing protein n=1 Tax=Mangrovihabitans endophyticus TaxID=1751298 RepID=A0A8J3C3J7_9ACTN|nr:hypothetical protein [Mangrovihabitans endophyticus]GGL04371.1 hypothetical protein GCM10012284_43720 [Mangrovihabitans endophyticus]